MEYVTEGRLDKYQIWIFLNAFKNFFKNKLKFFTFLMASNFPSSTRCRNFEQGWLLFQCFMIIVCDCTTFMITVISTANLGCSIFFICTFKNSAWSEFLKKKFFTSSIIRGFFILTQFIKFPSCCWNLVRMWNMKIF